MKLNWLKGWPKCAVGIDDGHSVIYEVHQNGMLVMRGKTYEGNQKRSKHFKQLVGKPRVCNIGNPQSAMNISQELQNLSDKYRSKK